MRNRAHREGGLVGLICGIHMQQRAAIQKQLLARGPTESYCKSGSLKTGDSTRNPRRGGHALEADVDGTDSRGSVNRPSSTKQTAYGEAAKSLHALNISITYQTNSCLILMPYHPPTVGLLVPAI